MIDFIVLILCYLFVAISLLGLRSYAKQGVSVSPKALIPTAIAIGYIFLYAYINWIHK